MKINMIVKFSKLKSSSCTLRITGQEPKFLFCFNIKLIKWCSGLTTQNRSRAAQLSEGCGTKGRAERQLCSRSSAVSRPAAHPRSSLGQGGDVSAASITRDVGPHIPSGRKGPREHGRAGHSSNHAVGRDSWSLLGWSGVKGVAV